MKKEGVIKATVATLDAARLNRPLRAFVHVDTTSWVVTRQLLALQELSDVEEIHTVTGESAILLKVRTRDTQSLEQGETRAANPRCPPDTPSSAG